MNFVCKANISKVMTITYMVQVWDVYWRREEGYDDAWSLEASGSVNLLGQVRDCQIACYARRRGTTSQRCIGCTAYGLARMYLPNPSRIRIRASEGHMNT
jgi:hypothetical protein